jgi:hypothetical protein
MLPEFNLQIDKQQLRNLRFVRDVAKANEALSVIYRMIILHEIGIDNVIVEAWLYTRVRTH